MSEMPRLARFSGALLLIVGGRMALGSPPQTASASSASREQITDSSQRLCQRLASGWCVLSPGL
jgi:hypothetical protein